MLLYLYRINQPQTLTSKGAAMTESRCKKAISREVTVFVSSAFAWSRRLLVDENAVTGRRFTLNDYANKADFIEAVEKFTSEELGVSGTFDKLLFDDVETDLCISVFTDHVGNISEELWKMLALSDEDLSLLDAYLSYHALLNYDVLNNSVEKALAQAKQCYIGYFPTNKDFIRQMMVDGNASEQSFKTLDETCQFEDLETHARRNSYNHRCHYFRKAK